MSNYRRPKLSGGLFFFTLVTFKRRPLFKDQICRKALKDSIKKVREKYPFEIKAWVLLPEHIHCIWQLPENEDDVSMRWRLIKSSFTRIIKKIYYKEELETESRKKRKESTIWQRRYWEHQIRDQEDYNNHIDYIHYNPVKHKLVKNVKDWEYSTFHGFVRNDIYREDWGGIVGTSNIDFGE
ncbi:MAG: transposase [Deltaproteobacteria bacterium]|nr:transposase [Deltaproteobacteria bacterium]